MGYSLFMSTPHELSLLLVFGAGLLKFFSPCVLPLIPSYLGIMGGVGLDSSVNQQPAARHPRLFLVLTGFVLGFSTVFIAAGIMISVAFQFIGEILRYITWAGGIFVIILGLSIIFGFFPSLSHSKFNFFQRQRETPDSGSPRTGNILTAFAAGAAFGISWTPCIGPILMGVLLLAGQSGGMGSAIFFLSVYSAGLALPFILVTLFLDSFLKHASRLRPHKLLIRRISGGLLVAMGVVVLIGTVDSGLGIAISGLYLE